MIPIWELEKKVMPIWETVIPIQEHIRVIRSMIPEWDTNSLLCFLLKNFVYQSLTDLTVMLFSEYLSVSHIDHRDAPHSTFFSF